MSAESHSSETSTSSSESTETTTSKTSSTSAKWTGPSSNGTTNSLITRMPNESCASDETLDRTTSGTSKNTSYDAVSTEFSSDSINPSNKSNSINFENVNDEESAVHGNVRLFEAVRSEASELGQPSFQLTPDQQTNYQNPNVLTNLKSDASEFVQQSLQLTEEGRKVIGVSEQVLRAKMQLQEQRKGDYQHHPNVFADLTSTASETSRDSSMQISLDEERKFDETA